MKKSISVGVCLVVLSATGALAQANQGQGGAPVPKAGAADTMKKGAGSTSGTTTGASPQDRATVPGSLNSGGTSQTSPNTAQPGASKMGGSN
ncbi:MULTISPECIES: hypothetical protein [unclassified Afipia]|uniref:hypothetical protein n=1 Tax=unclassified Afipia TaxID=2642050 RepID=UPI00041752D2|nr:MULTISPECIES: hypothetical protein [unclassified Afipia]